MPDSRVPRAPDRRRDDDGFTLLELLIVVAILGIVVNIAVPVMMNARAKGDAAKILADVDLIHDALLNYRLENGSYPRTAGWGRVPPGLAPYLPDGFEFTHGDVRYRYQLQRRNKRIGLDGGGRNSAGREVVQYAGAMFQGRKQVTARRAFLWLPSPGGRIE
jgi:prepilin-type N-terminal cleavage/methylation domain-containing protein